MSFFNHMDSMVSKLPLQTYNSLLCTCYIWKGITIIQICMILMNIYCQRLPRILGNLTAWLQSDVTCSVFPMEQSHTVLVVTRIQSIVNRFHLLLKPSSLDFAPLHYDPVLPNVDWALLHRTQHSCTPTDFGATKSK